MPLNPQLLGLALYTKRSAFNNKSLDELVQQYGDIEKVREAACVADAEAIIEHFTTLGLVTTSGTAAAQTGKIS